MKKVVLLSIVASTMIMAGGDFETVEEPIVDVPEVMTESGPYIGIAFGFMNDAYTRTPTQADPRNFDKSQSSIMLQGGYKFNEYVAVEGRYWFGIDDLSLVNENGVPYELSGPDAWGLYVKPMYPVTEEFDIYALLGYAQVDHNTIKINNLDGFSWGIGASYEFTENIAAFIDYTSLYDDDRDLPNSGVNKAYTIDSVNFGLTYNF